jgi:hypothetical protein
MRWRLPLEEYGPELINIKGENNIVANALSRLVEEFPKEEAASLFAGDIREFDLPTDYPLSYAEIQEKQQTDRYLHRRRLEPDSPYKY